MTQTTQNMQTKPEDNESGMHRNGLASFFKGAKKKNIIRWAAACIVTGGLIFGVPRLIHFLSHESTDDAFINGSIVSVSPRVSGHVARVHVMDNQWVRAGTLLVELDTKDFEARLNAAEAEHKSAEAAGKAREVEFELTRISAAAELADAESEVMAAEAAVREASARLAMAKAMFDQVRAEKVSADAKHQLDKADLKRYKEMAMTKMVSPQDLERAGTAEQVSASALTAAQNRIEGRKEAIREAEAANKAAEARLSQAKARLATAKTVPQKIEKSRFQADETGAEADRTMAELTQARLNLSYTKIMAPRDGFITRKNVEPGQFVQTGQSILAIVPRDVWVIANFKETQITHMKPGQPVDVRVDTYPDITFKGHVDSIQHGTGAVFSLLPPENATGNYVKVVQRVPVKIVFDWEKEFSPVLLMPGMSVVPEVNIKDPGRSNVSPDNKSLVSENKG